MLLLNRLRRAIARVRLMLSSSDTRWLLVRSASGRLRLSFRGRQGFRELLLSSVEYDSEYFDAQASPSSPSSSPSPVAQRMVLNRTLSGVSPVASIVISRTPAGVATARCRMSTTESEPWSSGDPDVDRKADEFIRKFRERLAKEHPVALKLPQIKIIGYGSSKASDSRRPAS